MVGGITTNPNGDWAPAFGRGPSPWNSHCSAASPRVRASNEGHCDITQSSLTCALPDWLMRQLSVELAGEIGKEEHRPVTHKHHANARDGQEHHTFDACGLELLVSAEER